MYIERLTVVVNDFSNKDRGTYQNHEKPVFMNANSYLH